MMRIEDFIWIPDFVDKIFVKHHVTQDEAEEIFFNTPHFRFVESGYRKGEDVYSACGQTDAGRCLIVFFVLKYGNTALIVSARDMNKRERKSYEKR